MIHGKILMKSAYGVENQSRYRIHLNRKIKIINKNPVHIKNLINYKSDLKRVS